MVHLVHLVHHFFGQMRSTFITDKTLRVSLGIEKKVPGWRAAHCDTWGIQVATHQEIRYNGSIQNF